MITPAWLRTVPLPSTSSTIGLLLRAAQDAGALDLPLPGAGSTLLRWRALAELAAADLALGRLAEAHTDAQAILAELTGAGQHGLWGVWAAEAPTAALTAERVGAGWRLHGAKAWCSGAAVLDRALVTAQTPTGRAMFAVAVADTSVVATGWAAPGLAAARTTTVRFAATPAEPVGHAGAYLDRAGFWHGAAGVAACWYGGALGVARALLTVVRTGPAEPHALAQLGAVDALVSGLAAHLAAVAAEIDADPGGPTAQIRAMRLRAWVEAGATEILDRAGRALGAGPLCLDPVLAQRAADLPVYLRQSHAERDLAVLGALAAAGATW